MPDVTVVVPTFERPEETRNAVLSALAQTHPPLEVVVVDDGSAEPFAFDHERVRVVRHERNRGAAAARNTGVREARGTVIAFLDSDDRWLPPKLGRQLPLLAPGSAVATGWIEERDGRLASRIRIPRESEDARDFFAGCWFCPGSTLVVARADFERCGPFDETLPRLEDWEWSMRFARMGGALRVAPIAGAVITIGMRNSVAAVSEAARRIRPTLADDPRAHARAAQAYLDKELAAAHRNAGNTGAFLFHMARSLARVPRRSASLRDWWRTEPVREIP